MISYETFRRLVDRSLEDNNALIKQWCYGDRSALSADELDYMRILTGEIPTPPDPSKILSQMDIDGILFVELPNEMSLEESRRWLSIRMVDYAMEQAKIAGPVYARSTMAECMYLTEKNINEAISSYRYKQWLEKLKHETPKEKAERDARLKAFFENRRKRFEEKRRKSAQAASSSGPAPVAAAPAQPSPAPVPAPSPVRESAPPPPPPRPAAVVVEKHRLPDIGPSVAPDPKEDLSFLC